MRVPSYGEVRGRYTEWRDEGHATNLINVLVGSVVVPIMLAHPTAATPENKPLGADMSPPVLRCMGLKALQLGTIHEGRMVGISAEWTTRMYPDGQLPHLTLSEVGKPGSSITSLTDTMALVLPRGQHTFRGSLIGNEGQKADCGFVSIKI